MVVTSATAIQEAPGWTRYVHEARAAGDHDVLDIGEGLELGGAGEEWRLLPHADILEELPMALAVLAEGWAKTSAGPSLGGGFRSAVITRSAAVGLELRHGCGFERCGTLVKWLSYQQLPGQRVRGAEEVAVDRLLKGKREAGAGEESRMEGLQKKQLVRRQFPCWGRVVVWVVYEVPRYSSGCLSMATLFLPEDDAGLLTPPKLERGIGRSRARKPL
jgi:hypothetical protein